MDLQHIAVKYFADDGANVEQDEFIPVFHQWIQHDVLDDMMIDVAVYPHVQHGPGIVLVCHECHYGMDEADGRLGLLCANKRMASGSVQDRFRAAFRRVLGAARRLEEDERLRGRLSFRSDEALVRISDYLFTPNTPEAFEAVKDDLRVVAQEVYGGSNLTIERVGDDPKAGLTIRITATDAADLSTLAQRCCS